MEVNFRYFMFSHSTCNLCCKFWKGFIFQESKKEVVFLCKNGGKTWLCIYIYLLKCTVRLNWHIRVKMTETRMEHRPKLKAFSKRAVYAVIHLARAASVTLKKMLLSIFLFSF